MSKTLKSLSFVLSIVLSGFLVESASVSMQNNITEIDFDDPIKVHFHGAPTNSTDVWKVVVVPNGKDLNNETICDSCWKRICGDQSCEARVPNGHVSFISQDIGGAGEYNVFMTNDSYAVLSKPVTFLVSEPSHAHNRSLSSSPTSMCNPKNPKNCMEVSLMKSENTIKVAFVNSPSKKWKLILVQAGEEFLMKDTVLACNGNVFEYTLGKKNGVKYFDLRECINDLPDEVDMYMITRSNYYARIGPIRLAVKDSVSREPTISPFAVSSLSPTTSSSSPTSMCNPKNPKNCMEVSLMKSENTIKVAFVNSPSKKWKLILVQAGEEFLMKDTVLACNGNVFEYTLGKKNGVKYFDLRECINDLPDEVDMYMITRSNYYARIGPIRLAVKDSVSREPTISPFAVSSLSPTNVSRPLCHEKMSMI